MSSLLPFIALGSLTVIASAEERPRARDLGIMVGTGPRNAITDVAGVEVGHATLIRGDKIRTGVTAILPHAGNLFRDIVPALCSSATRSASSWNPRRSKSSARSSRASC